MRQFVFQIISGFFFFFSSLTGRTVATTNQLSHIQKLSGEKKLCIACVTSCAQQSVGSKNETELWTVHLSSLLAFPPLYEVLVQGALPHIVSVLTSRSLSLECVYVRHVCLCMIGSKAVGSKRAAQCRILAITNEQREENKTYERKAERRKDSLWPVEMCIVSSFSCQHFFKPPPREEETGVG